MVTKHCSLALRLLLFTLALMLTLGLSSQTYSSVCIETITKLFNGLEKKDTVQVTYYNSLGQEVLKTHWLKGDKKPVVYAYTYNRKGQLKTQTTYFFDTTKIVFKYRDSFLYSTIGYTLYRNKWKKTKLSRWKYDKYGRIIQIYTPRQSYGYTTAFTYDSLNRKKEQINFNGCVSSVYRCRYFYNLNLDSLMNKVNDYSMYSELFLIQENSSQKQTELIRFLNGKISYGKQYEYDDKGRLKSVLFKDHSDKEVGHTTSYEYINFPTQE